MSNIKLYSAKVCPFVQRTKIALKLKGLKAEITEFDLSEPFPDWFIELNPEERVPVIQIDGKVLNESSVINEYIDEIFPEPALFPKDPYQKALTRVLIAMCNDHFIPGLYDHLTNQDRARDEELKEEWLTSFRQLNRWLMRHNPEGTYVWDSFGMGDLTFAPFFQRVVVNEHYRGFRLPETRDYSRVRKWMDALLENDAVRATGLKPEDYIQAYADYAAGST